MSMKTMVKTSYGGRAELEPPITRQRWKKRGGEKTRVLVVSDLHCGSLSGLCLPTFDMVDEASGSISRIEATEPQLLLYEAWQDMVRHMEEEPVDVVVVNGDVCDGMNNLDGGRNTITNDMFAQADMAAELLAMIPCSTFILTLGSGYHSRVGRFGMPIEGYLAKVLREKVKGRGGAVEYVPEALLTINDKKFHITHVTGHTKVYQYRSTGLMRDMTNLLLNWQSHKFGHIDMILRAHTHYYISISMGDMQGVISPCWKWRDSFATKVGSNYQPDVGYVVLEWEEGQHITTTPHLFHAPDMACPSIVIQTGGGVS